MGEAIRTTKRQSGQRAPRGADGPGAPPGGETARLAFVARNLARARGEGALATLGPDGQPFASFVALAWTAEGRPLFLLSTLADHTQNVLRDPRASLLVTQPLAANAQATPRVTLQGRLERTEDGQALTRYLVRHPEARAWAGFADFALYRMDVTACRVVLGFAQAHRLSGRQFLAPAKKAKGLAAHGPALLQCIMDDAALAGRVMEQARRAASAPHRASAGLVPALADCDGLDLVHRTHGRGALRLGLDGPAFTPAAWRVAVQRKAPSATRQR